MTAAEKVSSGFGPKKMSKPIGIFVDYNFDLYVADSENNRILQFQSGQTTGITVAGKGIQNKLELSNPTDLILDADGDLFIADKGNNRVIRSNENFYQCVIGCSDNQRSKSNPSFQPYAVRFDSHGNLFVADEYN
ncbi:unnamed protein product, partial [Rotaria magnacalcarata]